MAYPETLSEEIRRAAYSFVLSIYETFEPLVYDRQIIKDIETHANWFLTLVARYPISDNKGHLVTDMVGELKGIRALLGVARDISILERHPASEILEKCEAVESAVIELIESETKKEVSEQEETPKNSASAVPVGNQPSGKRYSSKSGSSQAKNKKPEQEDPESTVILRQKAIIEVLKRRDKVTVRELGTLFSGRVSKKTLQRDLQALLYQKVIVRGGDKRWTHYQLA